MCVYIIMSYICICIFTYIKSTPIKVFFLKSKVKKGKMKKCSVYEYKIIDTVTFF